MSEKAKNKGRLGGIASVLCFGIIGLGCGISMVPFMTYALEEEGNMFIFLLGVRLAVDYEADGEDIVDSFEWNLLLLHLPPD